MRAFLAIELTDEVKGEILRIINLLQERNLFIRNTPWSCYGDKAKQD